MFKQYALKLYRKSSRFEQLYGSKMADKMVLGRLWYKVFTQQSIKMANKVHKKSKADRILFDTDPDFSGDARALFDYLTDHGYNKRYKITWIVDEPEAYKAHKAKNVKFISRRSPYHGFHRARCHWAAAKARYVFFTKFFSWPEAKSAGQVRVNLGQGLGLCRRLDDGQELPEFDYCVVPGDLFVKPYARDFSCARKKILPVGGAGYYQFVRDRKEAGEFYQKLAGDFGGLKTICWMPLCRDPQIMTRYKTGHASVMGLPFIHSVKDMPVLDEICRRQGIRLLICANPDMEALRKETGDLPNISFITEEERRIAGVEIYELLPKFDALIGDYSSAALDYLLLDKPIGYILEDYEDFKQANGFIVDDPLEYMPGRHIYSLEDLESFFADVAAGRDDGSGKRAEVFKKTHNEAEDYCKRILEQLGIR